jgi:23S rRNA pseudouridine1911/1915/1917 synthase
MKDEARKLAFQYRLEQPKRLDIFLSDQIHGITRSHIQKIIRAGGVRINRLLAKPGVKLKDGDLLEVDIPPAKRMEAVAEDIPIRVLYEDNDVIVVDKPSGMVVHPGPGNERGTLVNALLYHLPDLEGIGGFLRPGIVHRLDKGTSGVMVVAKNNLAHVDLSAQFKARSVMKEYTALVHGIMEREKGEIRLPIGRHPKDRKRLSTISNRGKEAVTTWWVIKWFTHFSLIGVRIKTGRTHQIRVHLSSIHHPVVGDRTYGGMRGNVGSDNRSVRESLRALKRPFLHAKICGFVHPVTREKMIYEAPLPKDLNDMILFLESEDRR